MVKGISQGSSKPLFQVRILVAAPILEYIMKRIKIPCSKCGREISKSNYTKHIETCDGQYKEPLQTGLLRTCKHCLEEFSLEGKNKSWMANHTRWCQKNPKSSEYKSTIFPHQNEESRSRAIAGIKLAHKRGAYLNAPKKMIETRKKNGTHYHTEETKQILKEKALASPHRRLRKKMIEYNGVWLESSWELALAVRLDKLKVKWLRPDPIKWIDYDGFYHNYFPDFYLPDYDIYLDPKNPHARKVQKKKLKQLLTQYDNIVIIDTLEECQNYCP